jgi:hypothetical protein
MCLPCLDLISRSPFVLSSLNESLIDVSFYDDKLWLSNRSYILYGNIEFQGGLMHVISDAPYLPLDSIVVTHQPSTINNTANATTSIQPPQSPSQSVCLDNVGNHITLLYYTLILILLYFILWLLMIN